MDKLARLIFDRLLYLSMKGLLCPLCCRCGHGDPFLMKTNPDVRHCVMQDTYGPALTHHGDDC